MVWQVVWVSHSRCLSSSIFEKGAQPTPLWGKLSLAYAPTTKSSPPTRGTFLLWFPSFLPCFLPPFLCLPDPHPASLPASSINTSARLGLAGGFSSSSDVAVPSSPQSST